jgi:hypothetical protein
LRSKEYRSLHKIKDPCLYISVRNLSIILYSPCSSRNAESVSSSLSLNEPCILRRPSIESVSTSRSNRVKNTGISSLTETFHFSDYSTSCFIDNTLNILLTLNSASTEIERGVEPRTIRKSGLVHVSEASHTARSRRERVHY